MYVLEVRNIKKKLSGREIIKGIDFSIKEGEIFGFLGPNGAGKTTTIRMLVGLISSDSGSIKIMGHDIAWEREKALSEVGSMVENPELYKYLSGYENLYQVAGIRKVKKERIYEVAELVGLSGRIQDKVSKYSLGMRQRLGLGIALLSKPKLLILDEPTNGLDPSGILDFREIVKKAAEEYKMSVFISSHILSEIQQLCDKVAYINNGEIKAVENINDIENGLNEIKKYNIVTDKIEECTNILNSLDYIKDIKGFEGKLEFMCDRDKVPGLVLKLCEEEIPIYEIYKMHSGVEERYMELVEGGRRNEGSYKK